MDSTTLNHPKEELRVFSPAGGGFSNESPPAHDVMRRSPAALHACRAARSTGGVRRSSKKTVPQPIQKMALGWVLMRFDGAAGAPGAAAARAGYRGRSMGASDVFGGRGGEASGGGAETRPPPGRHTPRGGAARRRAGPRGRSPHPAPRPTSCPRRSLRSGRAAAVCRARSEARRARRRGPRGRGR